MCSGCRLLVKRESIEVTVHASCQFLIFLFFFLLEPVEEPLLGREEFKKVHTIL